MAEFLQALNVLAKDCVFKDVTAAQSKEEFIRDTFINGLSSSSIRQRLLEHADLDLRKAIDLADSLDMAQKQSATYSSTKLLYSASATTDRREIGDLNHQVSENERSAVAAPTFKKDSQRDSKRLCFFCGGPWDHIRKNCSARDHVCTSCGIKGHFSAVCRKSKTKRRSELNQTVSASAVFLASAVTKDPPVSLASATLPIVIAGIKTRALLDSGASRNFIGTLFVKSLGLDLIGSSKKIAMASTSLDQSLQGTVAL